MGEKLDIVTVLGQLTAHCDEVVERLNGVLINLANVKGNPSHTVGVSNQPKGGIDTGIV